MSLTIMNPIGGGGVGESVMIDITTDTLNFNLYNELVKRDKVLATSVLVVLYSKVAVGSSSPNAPGFTTAGCNPYLNLTIINNGGYFVGCGGTSGSSILSGGTALEITIPTIIDNFGIIGGGGGAGFSGRSWDGKPYSLESAPSGGGGGGYLPGVGRYTTFDNVVVRSSGVSGASHRTNALPGLNSRAYGSHIDMTNAGSGIFAGGGGGIFTSNTSLLDVCRGGSIGNVGGRYSVPASLRSCSCGGGGGLGAAGGDGYGNYLAGPGGAGGKAIVGISKVTLSTYGTIYGALV